MNNTIFYFYKERERESMCMCVRERGLIVKDESASHGRRRKGSTEMQQQVEDYQTQLCSNDTRNSI